MMGSSYAAEVREHVVRHRRGSIAAGLDQWAKRQNGRQKQADRERTKRRQEQVVASEIQRAESLTAKIEGRDAELGQILVNRPGHLQDRRAEVKRAYDRLDAAGMVERIERHLAEAARPVDFPTGCQAAYEPEVRRLRVRYELPPLDATVSKNTRFRYDKTERKPKPVLRNPTQRHKLYRETVARTTLRALADVFDVTPPSLVKSAVVNGYVAQPDPSSGQLSKLTMVSVQTTRQTLTEMNLAEPTLDPERCIGRLGGRISLQLHNLIPVYPVLPWIDVADHKVVDPASAALADRLDLLSLDGEQFEQLVERLFTAMSYEARRTSYSHDGGVDVYVSIEDPVHGVKGIVQAKRRAARVEPDVVRSLHGTAIDQRMQKAFLVTTGWFGQDSYTFSERNGMVLISGHELRPLLKDYLGLDSVISLKKLPPGWHPDDIA
jgi:restriction system protein